MPGEGSRPCGHRCLWSSPEQRHSGGSPDASVRVGAGRSLRGRDGDDGCPRARAVPGVRGEPVIGTWAPRPAARRRAGPRPAQPPGPYGRRRRRLRRGRQDRRLRDQRPLHRQAAPQAPRSAAARLGRQQAAHRLRHRARHERVPQPARARYDRQRQDDPAERFPQGERRRGLALGTDLRRTLVTRRVRRPPVPRTPPAVRRPSSGRRAAAVPGPVRPADRGRPAGPSPSPCRAGRRPSSTP